MTTPNMICSENNPNVLKTQPIRDEKKISEENWANQKWTKVGYAIFFQKVDKKCHEKIEWIFVTKAWFWPNYKTNLNENLVMLQSRVVLKTDIFSTACKHYFCGPLASRALWKFASALIRAFGAFPVSQYNKFRFTI